MFISTVSSSDNSVQWRLATYISRASSCDFRRGSTAGVTGAGAEDKDVVGTVGD
jgi:hypothetical protein